MDDFIRYTVSNLIDRPDEIELTCSETPKKVTYRLRVGEGEVGKIIGKQGRTITAIRNLLSAGAARTGQKALLQVDEPNEGR